MTTSLMAMGSIAMVRVMALLYRRQVEAVFNIQISRVMNSVAVMVELKSKVSAQRGRMIIEGLVTENLRFCATSFLKLEIKDNTIPKSVSPRKWLILRPADNMNSSCYLPQIEQYQPSKRMTILVLNPLAPSSEKALLLTLGQEKLPTLASSMPNFQVCSHGK